jgi:AcrR family transcriptional regulator
MSSGSDPSERTPDDSGAITRTRASEATRQRLLEAALEVIDRDGFEAAKVQDVAHAAGVTTGAIYSHFRNMDELLAVALAGRLIEASKRRHEVEIPEALERLSSGTGRRSILGGPVYVGLRSGFSLDETQDLVRVLAATTSSAVAEQVWRNLVQGMFESAVQTMTIAQQFGVVRNDLDARSLVLFAQCLTMGRRLLQTAGIEPEVGERWEAVLGHALGPLLANPEQHAQSGDTVPLD